MSNGFYNLGTLVLVISGWDNFRKSKSYYAKESWPGTPKAPHPGQNHPGTPLDGTGCPRHALPKSPGLLLRIGMLEGDQDSCGIMLYYQGTSHTPISLASPCAAFACHVWN